jgi:hypothetical protein
MVFGGRRQVELGEDAARRLDWYLPSWLGWLPGVRRESAALPSEA